MTKELRPGFRVTGTTISPSMLPRRQCADCGADIRERGGNADRCEPCATARRRISKTRFARETRAKDRPVRRCTEDGCEVVMTGRTERCPIHARERDLEIMREYTRAQRHAIAAATPKSRVCLHCGADISQLGARAKYCETCAAAAGRASRRASELRKVAIGVWRAGPTVWDWDGLVGASRCEKCHNFGDYHIGHPIGSSAMSHARKAHGFKGKAIAIPETILVTEPLAA